MIRHPSFWRLERFADRTADDRDRSRVAQHLASCERCRREIAALRALGRAAGELPTGGELPTDGFDRIRRRVEGGERVIVPTAVFEPPRAQGPRRWRTVAATAMALVLSVVVVSRMGNLEASDSTLELSPERPLAGAEIEATYRAGILLSGEERVVLRARLRKEGDAEPGTGPETRVLATLERADDGIYRGRFRLPDDMVYAALAVEATDGQRTDANDGRLWETWVHDASGRPTYAALLERTVDLGERNWELGHGVARELVTAYPDSVLGWRRLWLYERQLTPSSERDALERRMQEEFDRLHATWSGREEVPPVIAAQLWQYAWGLAGGRLQAGEGSADNPDGEGSPMAWWRDRALRSGSTDSRVLAVRSIYNLIENLGDPARGLAVADSLWRAADAPDGQLIREADILARRSGDPAQVAKWLRRAVEAEPSDDVAVGRRLLALEGYEAEGVAMLEQAAARLARADDTARPLGASREAYREGLETRQGVVLTHLARGHLALGDTGAARAVLNDAARAPWDASILVGLAEGLLQLGDTAASIETFGRLAADPLRTEAFADSVRTRLGPVDAGAWSAAVERGRIEVVAHVERMTEPWALRSRTLTVTSAGSQRRDLRAEAEGRFAVVSLWSRSCGYSLGELPELRRLQEELTWRGIPHAAVTDPDDPRAIEQALEEWGAPDLDVVYDVDGEVGLGFNAWTTPAHYVLGPSGLVRYRARGTGHIDDVLRVVEVLSAREDGASDQNR